MEGAGPHPDPSRDAAPPHRMPGWVRGLVVVGILAIVLLALASILGGAEHGASRHLPGDAGGEVEPREDGGPGPAQHP